MSNGLKAARILVAAAVAVAVQRELGLIAVGVLAVAVQLATVLGRRLRAARR